MNSAFLAVIVIFAFVIAYRLYASFLFNKVFQLSNLEKNSTPAHELRDDIDYVPTDKKILFGHHFSSIAGAAPIVGPSIAVMWGWLPAVIWVSIGVIFMGAAHDFGALVLSLKHKGNSIGQLSGNILNKRTKILFLTVIFFLVWMVLAVFALVIANLFKSFPSAVVPVNFEIIIAILMGVFINKKKKSLFIPSLMAQMGLLFMIWVGTIFPISFGENSLMIWIYFLMIYSFIASVLPVSILLQPRDYINSHQLLVGLFLIILGLFVTQPEIVAPIINPKPVGAPPLFPFLFMTIACGAISGFHGLVSSGTTSKQINHFKDAKPIGYGSMLGEGLLALLAILAATAGFKTSSAWHAHYSSWHAANGLNAKISAFVIGSGRFLEGLAIPETFSQTVIAVLIISFAATSLDTAARIQRYIIAEIGEYLKINFLKNRYIASFLAIFSAIVLLHSKSNGTGGLLLWPLFGATNQMLAGLTLIVVSVFLYKKRRNFWPYFLPAIFIVIITTLGLFFNSKIYYNSNNYFLLFVSGVLFLAQLWIVIEGILIIKNEKHA